MTLRLWRCLEPIPQILITLVRDEAGPISITLLPESTAIVLNSTLSLRYSSSFFWQSDKQYVDNGRNQRALKMHLPIFLHHIHW